MLLLRARLRSASEFTAWKLTAAPALRPKALRESSIRSPSLRLKSMMRSAWAVPKPPAVAKRNRSAPLPPVSRSRPAPPSSRSLPALPSRLSLPASPRSSLAAELPLIRLLRTLPVPLIKAVPVRVRLRAPAARVVVTLLVWLSWLPTAEGNSGAGWLPPRAAPSASR